MRNPNPIRQQPVIVPVLDHARPPCARTYSVPASKVSDGLMLDRIVGVSLLIDGYVCAVRYGESLITRDQHQRHTVLAGRSHCSIWPSIAAPSDDRNESAARQWLDAFDFVSLHDLSLNMRSKYAWWAF